MGLDQNAELIQAMILASVGFATDAECLLIGISRSVRVERGGMPDLGGKLPATDYLVTK